ncbi:Transposase family protein [Candidatus Bealeia paramacronuclearis]|uniref:Transposase family protein n=1 Tax=Candidatus Bealeia paramacronuclearis TaxID=1921001 RepID=A0ABZ2C173_9PROT
MWEVNTSPWAQRDLSHETLANLWEANIHRNHTKTGKCEDCDGGATTTQQANWYERNSEYTKAYEKHAVISLIHSTIADVAIKEDLSYAAVQGIIEAHQESLLQIKRALRLGVFSKLCQL